MKHFKPNKCPDESIKITVWHFVCKSHLFCVCLFLASPTSFPLPQSVAFITTEMPQLVATVQFALVDIYQ